MTYKLFLFIFLNTIVSCRTISRKKKVEKITIAIGGCSKGCEFSIYELDSNLTLKYYCASNCEYNGFYSGKISVDLWQTIEKNVNDNDLTSYSYKNIFKDSSLYIDALIKTTNRLTTLKGNLDIFPKEISNLISTTITHFRTVDMKPIEKRLSELNFDLRIPMDNYFNLPY